MEEVRYIDEGLRAVKVLVVSNNQICLNAICSLSDRLRDAQAVTSGGRINHNGGYLMHFFNGERLAKNFSEIRRTVLETDQEAKIVVYNNTPLSDL